MSKYLHYWEKPPVEPDSVWGNICLDRLGLSVKKTPAGMLHWGAVSTHTAKFGCCHEESHTGNSSARERWEIKEVTHLCFGSRTKTLTDDAATFMVSISRHLFDTIR
ncbi:unnamed protein product [Pleuronectes platessa]|uniref:Uncharacterized protein n=1 Tax=Pleuronectes platessa TaxID=8262 RepID=A0A9N7TYM6_PLEPL|nr:unnamed protein product [Pleuronectes platessa]